MSATGATAHHLTVATGAAQTGNVVVRGVTEALSTDVGRAFIADCARNTEGLMPDHEIKTKYELSDADWERLAGNTALLHAVRAERERRILSGEAAREAAQRHFAKAPNVLNRILIDEQVAPRHRIEAARELRQVVANEPDNPPRAGEKFVITINLGDQTLVYEKETAPLRPLPPEDGELL